MREIDDLELWLCGSGLVMCGLFSAGLADSVLCDYGCLVGVSWCFLVCLDRVKTELVDLDLI